MERSYCEPVPFCSRFPYFQAGLQKDDKKNLIGECEMKEMTKTHFQKLKGLEK
jgi:hypothetical protein